MSKFGWVYNNFHDIYDRKEEVILRPVTSPNAYNRVDCIKTNQEPGNMVKLNDEVSLSLKK